MKRNRFVQVRNPITGSYAKIDRKEGRIVSYSSTKCPYKNIPIIEKK